MKKCILGTRIDDSINIVTFSGSIVAIVVSLKNNSFLWKFVCKRKNISSWFSLESQEAVSNLKSIFSLCKKMILNWKLFYKIMFITTDWREESFYERTGDQSLFRRSWYDCAFFKRSSNAVTWWALYWRRLHVSKERVFSIWRKSQKCFCKHAQDLLVILKLSPQSTRISEKHVFCFFADSYVMFS